MILIEYHLTRGYKLFDPVKKQVVINRDVIIDKIKEWDLTKNIKKDLVRILFEEPTIEVEREVWQEEVRG